MTNPNNVMLEAAQELLRRRKAQATFGDYVQFTKPNFKSSVFSEIVTSACDQFLIDVLDAKRPIIVFQAPPQHGKSELISRKFPPYLMGKIKDLRIGAVSYNKDFASGIGRDVRNALASDTHLKLFPKKDKRRYDKDTTTEFSNPNGDGSYIAAGVCGGLTGKPLEIGIIDDPIKNSEEALSPVTKESHWNWYQTVFTSRMAECSGQIIMATSWAEDDLASRIISEYANDPRLKVLRFPALNYPNEVGYNSELPLGALVPELKSEKFLLEQKKLYSDYWWAAMYQQSARALGGNVFKDGGIRYYMQEDLPQPLERIICSWDCTFKDTDGSDFVVGQVWGKKGTNAYLLDQVRGRMGFTATRDAVRDLAHKWKCYSVYIEDKANGPAVIDQLKQIMPGIVPVEPDGSKLARAHAITSIWEAGNVYLPHSSWAPWVKTLTNELAAFPAGAHDDQVDALTQALRQLYPLNGLLLINQDVLRLAESTRFR